MKIIRLLGTIRDAEGGIIAISIFGPEHHLLNFTFSKTFDLPFPVIPGVYNIAISCYTEGSFSIDVKDENVPSIISNITPKMPFKFKTLIRKSIQITIQ